MAVASLVSTALPTFRHTHLIFQYLCGQATPLQQTPELTVLAHYRNSSEVLFTATCASDWNRKLNTSCIKQLKLSYPNSWWSKAKILLPFTRDKYSLEILGFQPSNGFVMVDNLGLHTNAICRSKKIPFFRFRRRRDEYLGDEVASQLPMYSACLKDLLGSSSGAPTCNMIHRDDGKYQVVADGSYTERWQKLSHLAYFSFSQRQVIYALKCDDYGGSLPLSPGYYGSQDFFLWENLPNTTTFPDGEKEVLTPRWVSYANSWAPSAIAALQDNCLKTMISRKVWNLTADAAAYMNTINPRGFMSVMVSNTQCSTAGLLLTLSTLAGNSRSAQVSLKAAGKSKTNHITLLQDIFKGNEDTIVYERSTYCGGCNNYKQYISNEIIILDKPYYLGCYEGVESKKWLAGKGSSAYLCAAECEATNDIFQAVGVDGEACVCLEQVNFSDIRKRDCTTRCPQEPEQLCGDGDSVLALYAYDCPTNWERFGRNCYREVDAQGATITLNLTNYLCMAEGALPFYPENHQDTKFITENFLSTGDKIVLPVYGSNSSDEVYYMVNYDQILPDNIYSPGVYLHVENWKCLQLKVTNTAESELVSTEYSSCSNTKVVCMKPLGGGSTERSETTSTGAVSGQEVVASNNLNLQAWPYQATWTTANNTIKASIEFEWQTKTIITGLRVTWTRKAPVRILKLSHDHEDRIFRGHVPYHMGEGQDADIFLYGEDGPEDDLPQHPVFQIDLTRPIVTQKLVIELKDFHENAEVDLRLFHHDTEEFKYDTGASFNQGVCNLSSSFVSEWSGKCVKIIESSPVDLTGTDPRNHTLDVCHGNRGRLFVPKTLEELFKMRQLAFEYVTSNKLSLKVLLLPLKFDGQTWLDLEDEEPFLLGNIVENLNYNERNILYFDIERPWPTKPYSYLFDDELDIISDDFLFFCEVDGERTCPFNSGGELERRCGQSPEPPAGFSAWGHPLVVHQDETLLQVYYSEDTRNAQHMYSTCSPWRECYRDRTGGIKCLDGGSFWTNIMRGEDCPDGIGFLGTCYVLLSTAADHFKSLKTCFDKRLVPVMPSNWRQHYFLQRLAASTDHFFLGYRAGNSFKPPATYNPVNLEGKEAMCIAWGSSTDDFEDSTWQFVGCKKQLPAVVCQVYEYKSLPSQVAWRAFPANGPLHYITRFGDAGSLPAASLFEWEEVCERYGARVLSLSSIEAMNQYADYLPDLPNYKIMWIGNLKDPTLGITVTAYGSEINVGAWGNNEWYITSKSKHRLVKETQSTRVESVTGDLAHQGDCLYRGCLTKGLKECRFPFRYQNRVYSGCIKLNRNQAWCSTLTDHLDNHVPNHWGKCHWYCEVDECPLTFHKVGGVCIKLAPSTLQVGTASASDTCFSRGARPFRPDDLHLLQLLQEYGSSATDVPKRYLGVYRRPGGAQVVYEDDTEVSPQILAAMSLPEAMISSDTSLWMAMIQNFSPGNTMVVEMVPQDTKASIICEAQVEVTIGGPDVGKVCTFPFMYDGRLYTSCAFDNTTQQPLCATRTHDNQTIYGNNWGFCRDPRYITVNNSLGLPRQYCVFPFTYGGSVYHTCTRKDADVPWCAIRRDPNDTVIEHGTCSKALVKLTRKMECGPDFWLANGTHCVTVLARNMTQSEAQVSCYELGAMLFPVYSDCMQGLLESMNLQENSWIAPMRINGRTPYSNLGGNSTATGKCVQVVPGENTWIEERCDATAHAVCLSLCSPGTYFLDWSCFRLHDFSVTAQEADVRCQREGKELLAPSSDKSLQHLVDLLNDLVTYLPQETFVFHLGLNYFGGKVHELDQEESAVTDSQVGAHCSGQRCGLKLVKQHHPATVPLQKFPLTESNHELNKHGFLCAERLLHPLTLEQPSCVLAPSNGDCTAPCEPVNEYYSYKKPLCPSGYLYQWGAGHRCYKLFSDTVSYVEAELRCAAEGGSLPNFPEEFFIHAFLLAMVKYEQEELNVSIPRLWVGYKSLPGTMKVYDTVGGEPSLKTQLPLANGEPFVDRGECMGLEGSTIPPYSLASMNCSTTAHFICMVDPEAPKCPYSYILYQGSCYMLVKPKSPVTFPEAEVLCAQEHGRLALESSVLTASFFSSWADLLDASTTWAGLSRTASGWLSSTTFNSTFVDMWDASHPQPGTDCAYRNVSSPGVWLSSHCTQPKDAYICLYTPGSKLPYWDHFCPENFTSHMGRCFMFVDEPKTHHEAEVSCAGRGSRLAALNDISTDLFLLTLMRLSSGTEMYIGVDDLETEGSFMDSYFNPWTLLDLNASNTEDLDCVVRREKEATAVDCSELHPFMCEWTAPASQEGFVLELRDGTRHLRLESPPATYKKMKTMCAHRGRTYHLSYPHTPYLHSLTAALLEEGNYTTAWLGRLDWSTKDNGQVPPLPVNTTMPATNNVTGCERAELGNDSMNISSANCLQEEVGICQMDACYSERGHQCIFPFINPNDTQTYVNCSFWHWNIPWCAVEVDSNNVTTRREFCLPDCPAMKPMVLCEDQPPAPPSPANLTFEQVGYVDYNTTWSGSTVEGTVITYVCPEGFVFGNNNVSEVRVECDSWTWRPDHNTSVPCTPIQCDADVLPHGNWSKLRDVGDLMPAWRRPTDYTMQRFYECDKWYVFAGTGKRTFMVECNSTGSWDPPEVPDCIPKRPCKAISPDCPQAHSPEVLCPEPPEEPLNGTRIVVMDMAFYTCDPGLEFPSGERQMNTTCLMGNKTWDIDVVPDCEVRRCRHDPPAPHPGMRSDWSPGRRELDTVITYHCPDNYVTWGENSTKQEVTCVHFQDKDTLIWDKEEVLVCNQSDTSMLTRYDPLPDMEVRYVYTTRYYWENIPNNMTDSAGDQTNLFVVTGPFGFGYGISLLSSAKQCQVHQQYNQKADKCSANPADCELGFSMSVWYNTALREDDWDHVERNNIQVEDDLNPTQQIRTIISTGGDTAGHPGMSLYQRGLWLCGVVSTGDQFWQVCSVGHILDLTWTNVGLRWHRTDGLELYVNTDKVAHKRVPESSQAKGALSPPEVMVGCHRDSDNKVYRDFNDASFDEVASWTRQLNDTEVIFFYGGYAEEFAGDDPASFEDKVDMADTMNLDTLAVLYNGLDKITAHHDPPHNAPPPTMATTITTSQGTQSSPTATAPTSTEQTQAQEIKGFQTILGIVSKLTEKDLPSELTPKQCNAMLKLVGTFSNLFGVNNIGKMKALQREKDNPGSAKVIQQMNSWFTNLMRQARYNTSLFLNLTKITENKLFVGHKVNLSQWRASDRDYVTTPNYGVIGRLQEWDFPFDRVAVSHEVVAEETCGERDISLTVIYSRTYHLSAFTTVNPARLPVNRPYALNSRTLTVNVATDPPPGQEDQTDDPECQPKPEDLLEHPIRIKLRHLGHHSFKTRTLKFHENVVAKEHQFERRYCAWWNPLLSDFGSWDTDGCVVIATNDRWTKCACAHLGTYTILAEMVEPKEVPEEQTWLTVLKYVGYFLSFLFIILYVIVIAISSDLKDQFHLMGLHLALAVFLGAIFMLASDLHGVREDRHSCTAIGTLIHFFYQAAGAWVFCLGIASFQAIVSGVIGGRLKAYVAISWGLPFISVGLTYIMFMMDLGDDPRCFISWYNPAKIVFFSFQMVFVLVSIVGATVVLSNMSTPALRKDNLVEDYGSFCGGAAYVMIFFDITWTFAMLAYLRLGFKKPDFYPIFQVLNSWTGLIIFIFIGMGSRRFRMVVAGQAKQRRQMLLGYAFGAPPASRETSPQAPGSPQIQRSQTSSPHPISESDPHTNPSLLEQDTRPHSAISAPHLRPPSRGHVAGRPGSRPASPFI